jgi:hypothetical protein
MSRVKHHRVTQANHREQPQRKVEDKIDNKISKLTISTYGQAETVLVFLII